MKSLETARVHPDARVLVRCDIDVPIENGKIGEPYRLDSILPTLFFLKEKKARIIIAGHIGDETSTEILKPFFDEKLGKDSYELLENLRFNPGEKRMILITLKSWRLKLIFL
jgi:phosphoglycerate kinase